MTKTYDLVHRSRESAARHLEGSLRRLRTDHLDLWQLHSVRSVDDVDRAFKRGGAMEYILEAQRQGVVRYVGVTGHQDPAANLRTLHYWDEGLRFDAMQMPLNPIDYHQRSFERQVLPELVKRDIGVIAMKTSGDGRLLRSRVCTAAECHRYAWSLPVSVAVVGMERPALVRENARYAREFRELTDAESGTLLQRVAPRGASVSSRIRGRILISLGHRHRESDPGSGVRTPGPPNPRQLPDRVPRAHVPEEVVAPGTFVRTAESRSTRATAGDPPWPA